MKFQPHILAAALLLAGTAAQAQTVSVVPAHTDTTIGSAFQVDIQATGFPDKIFGGGYNLAFDPTILKLDGITFPVNWEFSTSTGLLDAVAGTVSDINFNTFAAPIKGDFLTATLKFTAIGAGTSAITLSDSGSFPFGNELSAAVPVTFNGGTVTVAAVPEPGSVALMLGGLACVGWLARRRQT